MVIVAPEQVFEDVACAGAGRCYTGVRSMQSTDCDVNAEQDDDAQGCFGASYCQGGMICLVLS